MDEELNEKAEKAAVAANEVLTMPMWMHACFWLFNPPCAVLQLGRNLLSTPSPYWK